MALLKSLIQRLLDSRTTPAQAVSANGMDLAHVTDVPWTEGDQMTYVAPSNGYIKLWIQAVAGSASDLGCDITVNNHRLIGTSVKTVSLESGLWMKVKKADSIRFTKWGAPNPLQKVIEFIPSIGGGHSRIIWRALPCLRALSNYSPRSFCKANPNGSAIKLCQTIQPSGLFTHLKAHPVNTLLRVTDTSLFTLVAMNGRKSGMETEVSLSPQRVLPTSAFKCLSLKAPKLGMRFRTPWPTELKKRPLSLFQQSERNALTGGALC